MPIPASPSGPLEVDRPWDSHTDDQLAVLDHLGVDKFMVLGFCIGGPFIWNLLKRAPNRVVAAVTAQPVGFRPEMPNVMYDASMKPWAEDFVKRRPDVTMETAEKYVSNMFHNKPDFVFTVTRDFVRNCQTPVLVLPDDIPAHSYAVAMEVAMLAPKAEVSMFPWKMPPERIPLAVRQIHSFLRAHHPVLLPRRWHVRGSCPPHCSVRGLFAGRASRTCDDAEVFGGVGGNAKLLFEFLLGMPHEVCFRG